VTEIVVVELLGSMAERWALVAELRALSRISLALELFLNVRILGFEAETGSTAASAAAGSVAQAVG
jgi:hypothetical protein